MIDAAKSARPGRWSYYLAIIPFIAGCVICSLLVMKMVRGLMSSTDAYPRILVPGVHVLALPEPGDYTIFFESKSVFENKAYVAPEDAITGIVCSIQNADTGAEISVRPSSTNMSYELGGHEGTSVFEFMIPAAGSYRISAAFPDGRQGSGRYVFAIGHGFMKDTVQTIAMGFGIAGTLIISIGISVAGIVIIYLRRSRHAEGV